MMQALLLVALVTRGAGSQPANPASQPAIVHRLVFIVGRAESIENLSSDDLRLIFLGRITRLGGRRIIPVILQATEPAQRYFLRHVAEASEIDFTQWWIGAVFRGAVAAPPRLARSPSDACFYVASHRNAIGFVEASQLTGEIKPITVDGRPYDAADYPFQWSP
jgi:ABC-type phosphate transport system substrate-binding protein